MKKLVIWISGLAEIAVVFVGMPLLYRFDLIPVHKFIPLLAVFLVYLIILLSDKTFSKKVFGFNSFRKWKPLVIRMFVFLAICVIAVLIFLPGNFFFLPRKNPLLYLLIFIFYPMWSAYPQELIYRAYFYHRFGNLISNETVLIVINALLFSFSHIIFRNWVAIALTFFGSVLFSYTYKKSNSLMVTFIEHALYGNIIFATGLGQFFYLPLNM
jgi:membrane protease YdiL (CAAX protease family)